MQSHDLSFCMPYKMSDPIIWAYVQIWIKIRPVAILVKMRWERVKKVTPKTSHRITSGIKKNQTIFGYMRNNIRMIRKYVWTRHVSRRIGPQFSWRHSWRQVLHIRLDIFSGDGGDLVAFFLWASQPVSIHSARERVCMARQSVKAFESIHKLDINVVQMLIFFGPSPPPSLTSLLPKLI